LLFFVNRRHPDLALGVEKNDETKFTKLSFCSEAQKSLATHPVVGKKGIFPIIGILMCFFAQCGEKKFFFYRIIWIYMIFLVKIEKD